MKLLKFMSAIGLSVAISQIAISQELMPVKDDKIFYEEIDSTGAPNETIYNKAKVWFAEAFNDSKEVLQVDDKGSGILVGKGNYTFTHFVTPYVCSFTAKINIKEGKYRLQLYDFELTGGTAKLHADLEKWNKKGSQKKIVSNIHNRMLELISSFKKSQHTTDDDDF